MKLVHKAKDQFKLFDILTIGHSNRSIQEFLDLLVANQVTLVVDIRTIPKSLHNPQFGGTQLRASLRRKKIDYIHLPELGGLRKPVKDSVNTAWRNKSFQGYADYMQTEEFRKAITQLIELSKTKRAAVLCAEAVPWRCHRSLVADALVVRGFQVGHIMNATKSNPHRITPWARVKGKQITYPEEAYEQTLRAA